MLADWFQKIFTKEGEEGDNGDGVSSMGRGTSDDHRVPSDQRHGAVAGDDQGRTGGQAEPEPDSSEGRGLSANGGAPGLANNGAAAAGAAARGVGATDVRNAEETVPPTGGDAGGFLGLLTRSLSGKGRGKADGEASVGSAAPATGSSPLRPAVGPGAGPGAGAGVGNGSSDIGPGGGTSPPLESSPTERAETALSNDSDDGEEESLFMSGSNADKGVAPPSIDDFTSLRVLGKGSYGKVVLVRRKSTGVLYAMKILKKGEVVRKRQVERTKIERRVLGNVEHPFLMRLHYAFQTDSKLYLVLDYCPGGELFFHLSRYKRFPEGVVRFYAAELVLALKHLHDNSTIYRDIKPENILLDGEGHLKLGDFGLAKDNVTDATFGAQSVCGTPEYMAPEVINKAGHGTAVDWWGLGMLMYEMLTGLPPWYTKDRQKLFERLRGAPLVIPKNLSAPSASIIQGLLTRNPAKRLGALGARQVMNHEFFRGLDWGALLARRIPAPLNPCRHHGPGSESTHNFDPQFTRLPIVTTAAGQAGDQAPLPNGHFDGFTFEIPGPIDENAPS